MIEITIKILVKDTDESAFQVAENIKDNIKDLLSHCPYDAEIDSVKSKETVNGK